MKPLLCIAHSPCADGFGAAWALNRFCDNNAIPVEFYPGVYQKPPPDVSGRHVVLVDFAYKADVLAEMHHVSRSLSVFDHHKTARDDLSLLASMPVLETLMAQWRNEDQYFPATALFDMERSGAGLVWDYFFRLQRRPELIDHIEDRDLWRFKLKGTREINANIFSFPYDFKIWDKMMFLSGRDLDNFRDQGAAIERKHHKDIGELLEIVTRPMRIGGFVVPVANLPYTLTSDAGHELCGRTWMGKKPDGLAAFTTWPFAACYWDTADGRQFSLRSRDDGMDVGEIAKLYGGGGHPHASGFRVAYSDLAQFDP